MALRYGITDVPLTYDPPVKHSSELEIVQQDKADAPDLVRGYLQVEPARQLPKLRKVPILVVTAEASYHAPYDHCTVNYLRQAGVRPHWMKLRRSRTVRQQPRADDGKNSKEIADLIIGWTNDAVAR